VIYVKIFLAFLISAGVVYGQNPIGYNEWKIDETTTRVRFGGGIQNYPDTDSTFAKINNTYLVEGDSVLYNHTSVLKSRINKTNGVATVWLDYDGMTYEVEQKPVKLIWLNIQTKKWIDVVPSLSWGEPTVIDSSIRWDFPGFDYSVIKDNGQIFHKINFKKAFLDSAVVLYNQRNDQNRIALAIVHRYSFTNIDDSTLLDINDVDNKKLKQFTDGNYFDFSKQWLQYDSCYENPDIPIRQRWTKVGDYLYMTEYVMMSHVKAVHEKYPLQDIWHYTTDNFGRGSNECESVYIAVSAPTTNNENASQNQVYRAGTFTTPMRWGSALNTVIDGVTINSATVNMVVSGSADDFEIYANVFHADRDWIESEITPTVWKGTSNFSTLNGRHLTEDIDSAGVDSFNTAGLGVGDPCDWDVTATMQVWADDISLNQGWNFFPWTGSYSTTRLHSDDATQSSNRPYLEIDYTSGGGPTPIPNSRRKIMQTGEIDYEKDVVTDYLFATANSIKQ